MLGRKGNTVIKLVQRQTQSFLKSHLQEGRQKCVRFKSQAPKPCDKPVEKQLKQCEAKISTGSSQGYDTGIKIYDSLRRQKVPLLLSQEKLAKWYSCGPTVYDDAHVGHAFTYVKFDIVRRIMQDFFDINVVYLLGITDIDDKIITKAQQEEVSFQQVAKKYELDFMHEMKALNVLEPTLVTRVTDFIPNIIHFIQTIMDKGYAYKTKDGSVYFDNTAYGQSGKFRAAVDEPAMDPEPDSIKKAPHDFALWKAAKPHEPWWESPWGRGRPGWHIECSAMASHVFGEHLDIHSGGIDLIFPHHENELSQCAAFHGSSQWASYWLHSGHVYLQDQKMSKSLKNIITVDEYLDTHTAEQFRLFCLLASLRNNVAYDDAAMNYAIAIEHKLQSFLNMSKAYVEGQLGSGVIEDAELLKQLKETRRKATEALADNFETYDAIMVILELISTAHKQLVHKGGVTARSPGTIAAVASFVDGFFSKLGLDLIKRGDVLEMNSFSPNFSDVMNQVMQFRQQVRQFALASDVIASKDELKSIRHERLPLVKACDEMRHKMLHTGIHVQDHHRERSTWSFVSRSKKKK